MSRERLRFESRLGFPLDGFQVAALDALDKGHSVLVAAPTGSGKTVVAEYAVALAIGSGRKAFYTSPLKALSNQKYSELVSLHGAAKVGLLTGDNVINPEAPAVVMTTEVLRNMIYSGSSLLDELGHVVLDEVHYLQNPYRGAVWEEVIVNLAQEVRLVCLSATVSNAEQLAEWIRAVRGPTDAVIETHRPVELRNHYMVGDRSEEELLLLDTFAGGRPNPKAAALDPVSPGRRRARRLYSPRRAGVVERLDAEQMLPAIYFIFSRAGCDEAVDHVVASRVELNTPEEADRAEAIAEAKISHLCDADLTALGYQHFLSALKRGIAAHHAGMVPPFKEAVEACFYQALVKVVFATETLALGVNMPARSVVIEKLTKFTGEHHEPLTPAEFAQITGRAGRRGIDVLGHAIVLYSPYLTFGQVAALAASRSYSLTSSFRPNYNMAANLVRRYSPEEAHHILNLSFAQFQADADLVRMEAHLERTEEALARSREKARCELGDVSELTGGRDGPAEAAVHSALSQMKPGDVVVAPSGPVLVVTTATRHSGQVVVHAATPDGHRVRMGEKDWGGFAGKAFGRVDLPVPFAPRSSKFWSACGRSLRRELGRLGPPPGPERAARRRSAENPAASCPDLRAHLEALARARRYERDVERLMRRIRSRDETLARQFDRVLSLLEDWRFLDGWKLTAAGERLRRIYHEADLLVTHVLDRGLFDGLGPAQLAALCSVFTYEPRGAGVEGDAWLPGGEVSRRWHDIERAHLRLNRQERASALSPTRPLHPGFARAAYRWAQGAELSELMDEEDIGPGDFVRNVKQLSDLLRQVGEVAPSPGTRRSARSATEAILRGVVAASLEVSTPAPGMGDGLGGDELGGDELGDDELGAVAGAAPFVTPAGARGVE
ncbi:MAG: DEAD/DEAH box helicase [Acidimicrobiales bacterium]